MPSLRIAPANSTLARWPGSWRSRLVAARTRDRERGQVLPFFALMLMTLALFATLVIDGSFILESRHDLEVIASHAAQAGATQLDLKGFAATCGPYLKANPGKTWIDCQASPATSLKLDAGKAASVASASANDWMNELNAQKIGLPGHKPSNGIITVDATALGIAVTVRYCYDPFLINIWAGSGGVCAGSALISATVNSLPQVGH